MCVCVCVCVCPRACRPHNVERNLEWPDACMFVDCNCLTVFSGIWKWADIRTASFLDRPESCTCSGIVRADLLRMHKPWNFVIDCLAVWLPVQAICWHMCVCVHVRRPPVLNEMLK